MTRCRISSLQVLYWLSGLTCTDENFIIKAGAQRAAAAHGIALVAPDTSPRMSILNPCAHRVLFLGFMPVLYISVRCKFGVVTNQDDYEFRISFLLLCEILGVAV